MSHGKKAAAQVDSAGSGSRHAVLRRLAGRGGDGAEQSNQIMSGVCGHWVRKYAGVSQITVPLPWLDTGGGSVTDQPASAELSQGRTVSRRRENRLRTRAELLLLPGSLRCLSYRGVSGGSGLFQVQLFLLYHRLSHFAGSPAGTLYLRFSVPLRLVSGTAA